LYVDNAKVYRSPQLARIAASLGILMVHTPPYQPEGRGKIERFFRSVREQFLANLDRKQTLTLDDPRFVFGRYRTCLLLAAVQIPTLDASYPPGSWRSRRGWLEFWDG